VRPENMLTYSKPWPHYIERLSRSATGDVGCGCRVTNLSPTVSLPPLGAAISAGSTCARACKKRNRYFPWKGLLWPRLQR